MNTLFGDILKGLQKKFAAKTADVATVARVLEQVLGISVPYDAIRITQQGVVSLQVSPTIKAAIRLEMPRILELLKDQGITSIR